MPAAHYCEIVNHSHSIPLTASVRYSLFVRVLSSVLACAVCYERLAQSLRAHVKGNLTSRDLNIKVKCMWYCARDGTYIRHTSTIVVFRQAAAHDECAMAQYSSAVQRYCTGARIGTENAKVMPHDE
eukprot:2751931-Pleurochrysis_carterae.AAC.1